MINSGAQAEALARHFLEKQGLRTLEQNFQCKTGEIDLIMLHGELLVFIEVKYRQPSRFSSAAGAVDKRKQRKIIQTAMYFRHRSPKLATLACRFDVIAYEGDLHRSESPRWIQRAFESSG